MNSPPGPGSASDRRRDLGRRGEEATARWYVRAGYDIVARNWRCAAGELDLVVVDPAGAVLVFCEVKTRSSSAYGAPEEAVTPVKQRRLRRLAARWLSERPVSRAPTPAVRFDVAAVRCDWSGDLVVEVLRDAF